MATAAAPASNTKKYLTVTALGLATSASIVTSLRGLPMMAKEELTMFFYIGFSTVLFLIPAGLIAAELGSAYANKAGGLYAWISGAFGKRLGFATIFLAWLQVMTFYPTGLSFVASAAAFTIDKPHLADNNTYIGLFCIICFWLCTAIALVSNRFATKVAQYGFVAGTAIPGILLVGLFLWWVLDGQSIGWDHADNPAVTTETDGHEHPRYFPHIVGLSSVAFLGGILLNFAGIESQAPHATELKNPKRQYPVVILMAAAVAFGIFTLGALAVAGILPYDNIDLNTGVFDTFRDAFSTLFGTTWPLYIITALITYGALSGILAWVIGPSRGVLATAHDGMLPPVLQKVNKNGVQVNILIIQGIVVTLTSSIYFLFSDVNAAFFLISSMAVSVYLIIYMVMYAAAIRLRYTQPDLPRPFKLPGGLRVMWLVGGGGFLAMVFAFVIAFVPPDQLEVGNSATYILLVAVGAIGFPAIPFIIERFRKPSWVASDDAKKAAAGPSDEIHAAKSSQYDLGGGPSQSGGQSQTASRFG